MNSCDDIKELYNFLICCEKLVGSNEMKLPGRDRIRSTMIKNKFLKAGDPCPWKKIMKLLNSANMIEVKSCLYTKLTKYTIGEFINKLKIGISKVDKQLTNFIINDTISTSNELPYYIKKRRKQLYPKQATYS